MKKDEMNRIIKFELEYIPKGSTGSVQNKLRYHYNIFRRKGIVKGISREECLKDAIDRLKEDYPSFNPKFDDDFFKIHKKDFFSRLLDRIKNRTILG
jgi:hypothetical protein